MSRNPITGDKIATKPSKAYAENYDAVFRRQKCKDRKAHSQFIAKMIDGTCEVIESESCPMCDVVEIDEAAITQA